MDRLTSLTVFGTVVETGGFLAAARRLNMSETMVNDHIRSLEEPLGMPLLDRTTAQKMSLTEIGKAYYERSRQILIDLDEVDQIADALRSTPSGTLRVLANVEGTRNLSRAEPLPFSHGKSGFANELQK
jgi:DNA-binding transcriptional LysR family regulator